MTRSHYTLMFAAISALGFAGWKSRAADGPGGSVEPTAARPAGADAPKLVLLDDGRIIGGVVTESEDDGKIVVAQPAGVMRFPERKVVRVFDTIQEIHRYKCDQVPEEDLDEQLKLAHWCMSRDLFAEAQEHIKNILAIDPKHGQAKAIAASIQMTETRTAMNRQRDAAVQQTSAEVVEAAPSPAGRPATLDSAVVQRARRDMGVNTLPVVFDLPPGAALKRANEFQKYVHPILQTYCAKCHDDRYEGEFHLIGFKTRAERTADTLRANLDAALRLVDRENPGRSELLASSLRPHGQGRNTRPIFEGSNDRAYQILAAWVNNLRIQAPPTAALSAEPANGRGSQDFAVDRTRISPGSVEVAPVTGPTIGQSFQPPQPKVMPPVRYSPDQGFVDDSNADPSDFPIPFAVSGVKPKLPPSDGQPAAPAARPKASAAPAAPAPPATAEGPTAPPTADQAAAAAIEAGDDAEVDPAPEARKPPKQKVKLDPALLQRALQMRNGPK